MLSHFVRLYSWTSVIMTSIIWIVLLSGLASLRSQFSCILISHFMIWSATFFLQSMWWNSSMKWIYFTSKHKSVRILSPQPPWLLQCFSLSSDWLKFALFLSEILHTISSISVVWRTIWSGFCVKTISSHP